MRLKRLLKEYSQELNSTTKRTTSFFNNNQEYVTNNYNSNIPNPIKSDAFIRKSIIVDSRTPN